MCPVVPGSLDCPFLIATSSSCVPCGARFSGFSILDCHFFVLCALWCRVLWIVRFLLPLLRIVCPVVPGYLDFPFCIATSSSCVPCGAGFSGFSVFDCHFFVLCALWCRVLWIFRFWLPLLRLLCPVVPGSLDCPFLIATSSSCVPCGAGFSGLSVFDCHFFVLCALWCRVLWIVHFWLPLLRLVCPVVPGSLDCPFLIATSSSCVPCGARFSGFSILIATSSSCVPCGAGFSGLSVFYCHFFVLCALWCRVLWIFRFVLPLLRLVCPVVPGSLDCPFFIATSSSCVPCGAGFSGLSVFDCHFFVLCALWCRVLWIVRFWLPLLRLVCPVVPGSLDFPFLIATSSSCVPCGAGFSGLSVFYCHFFVLCALWCRVLWIVRFYCHFFVLCALWCRVLWIFRFWLPLLRLVCPVVPGSLDCPFLIATSSSCVPCGAGFSGLSVFDCHFFVLCALWCRVLWIVRFWLPLLRLVCPVVPGSLDCPFLIATSSSCVPCGAGFSGLSVFDCHFFVLCALWCRVLWIVRFWLPLLRLVCPVVPGSLDCPFLIATSSSCVPCGALWIVRFWLPLLRLVCPVVPGSLDCPFLIATSSSCVPCGAGFSGLSVFDCHFFVLCALWCRVLWIVPFLIATSSSCVPCGAGFSGLSVFDCHFFVLCALWCRVLWIVRFWLPLLRLVCPVVPGSLDCPFLIATSSSCVPCGAGFSGLSVFDCHFFVLCALWCRVLWIVRFWLPLLRLVCPVVPGSLDCPFLIATSSSCVPCGAGFSGLSVFYCHFFVLCALWCRVLWIVRFWLPLLRLVCPVVPGSLDCPFFIATSSSCVPCGAGFSGFSVFDCHFFVLCALWCRVLWIVRFWLPLLRLVCPVVPGSLDCPFLIATSSSCVPCGAGFSGLSVFYCHFFVLCALWCRVLWIVRFWLPLLRLVCPVVPGSLDFPFLIATSSSCVPCGAGFSGLGRFWLALQKRTSRVAPQWYTRRRSQSGKSRFGTTGHTRRRSGLKNVTIQRTRHHRAHKTKKWQSKTDNPENPAPQGTQDEEVAIKNGQSREPGTTGHSGLSVFSIATSSSVCTQVVPIKNGLDPAPQGHKTKKFSRLPLLRLVCPVVQSSLDCPQDEEVIARHFFVLCALWCRRSSLDNPENPAPQGTRRRSGNQKRTMQRTLAPQGTQDEEVAIKNGQFQRTRHHRAWQLCALWCRVLWIFQKTRHCHFFVLCALWCRVLWKKWQSVFPDCHFFVAIGPCGAKNGSLDFQRTLLRLVWKIQRTCGTEGAIKNGKSSWLWIVQFLIATSSSGALWCEEVNQKWTIRHHRRRSGNCVPCGAIPGLHHRAHIATSSSRVPWHHRAHKEEVAIFDGQSRELGTTGCTRRRSGNQKWTIQKIRHCHFTRRSVAIKNGKSREPGPQCFWRSGNKKRPENPAPQGTQDEEVAIWIQRTRHHRVPRRRSGNFQIATSSTKKWQCGAGFSGKIRVLLQSSPCTTGHTRRRSLDCHSKTNQKRKIQRTGTTGHTRRRSGNKKRTIQRTRHHRVLEEVAIKNGQSREPGTTGCTRKKSLDFPVFDCHFFVEVCPVVPGSQGTQDEEVAMPDFFREPVHHSGAQDEEVAMSNFDCTLLRLVWPVVPEFSGLGTKFLIATSSSSSALWCQGTQDEEVAIKNGQSRELCTTGHTRRRLAILRTIQRTQHHRVHKTKKWQSGQSREPGHFFVLKWPKTGARFSGLSTRRLQSLLRLVCQRHHRAHKTKKWLKNGQWAHKTKKWQLKTDNPLAPQGTQNEEVVLGLSENPPPQGTQDEEVAISDNPENHFFVLCALWKKWQSKTDNPENPAPQGHKTKKFFAHKTKKFNSSSRELCTTGHTRRRSGNQKRTIQRTCAPQGHKTKKWQSGLSEVAMPLLRLVCTQVKCRVQKLDCPENPALHTSSSSSVPTVVPEVLWISREPGIATSSSCVPTVVPKFSGLSSFWLPLLRLVWPKTVQRTLAPQGTQDEEVAIKNGQSRELHHRHKTKKCQKRTIQRTRHHRAHKTKKLHFFVQCALWCQGSLDCPILNATSSSCVPLWCQGRSLWIFQRLPLLRLVCPVVHHRVLWIGNPFLIATSSSCVPCGAGFSGFSVFDCHFFVLCALWCRVLWIFHFWLPVLCALWCIATSSSCVPCGAGFSGLSVFYCHFFVLCALWCRVLWIVRFWLPLLRLVCPVVPGSLDCPFLIATSSSCVPCGAGFSGLSVFYCHFFVLCALWCRVLWIFRFWLPLLRLVCPVVPGSLDCPFLIATSSSCVPCGAGFSGLSVFNCHFFVLCALWCRVLWIFHFWLPLLRLVCPVVPGSLDCPFFIATSSSCVPCGAGFSGFSVLDCHFFVLCALWCRVLWIVRFWLPLLRLVCPVVPGSLDFPFLIATSSSSVPCGAGFSGLSVFYCHFFVLCALWCRVLWIVRFWLPLLRLVCPVVPGSLDCPFFIATSSSCVPCGAGFSGLSVFDCHFFVLCALWCRISLDCSIFDCHFFVLCALWCRVLWIVRFWLQLLRLVCPVVPGSLDCPFLIATSSSYAK